MPRAQPGVHWIQLRGTVRQAFPLVAALSDAVQDATCEPAHVEDLLLALPARRSPSLRPLCERCARHGSSGVRRAAMQRLTDLIGPEARDLLRTGTRDPNDRVRIAALSSLRAIGCVDATVTGLANEVYGTQDKGSLELRIALAEVLAGVLPEHRDQAARVLRRFIEPKPRSLMRLLSRGSDSEDQQVLIAAARTLIAIGGIEGERVVKARMAVSKGNLRDELAVLLGPD